MRFLHINTRDAFLIIFAVIFNNINVTQMVTNNTNNSQNTDHARVTDLEKSVFSTQFQKMNKCPSNIECDRLEYPCIDCDMSKQCTYGEYLNVTCEVKFYVSCHGKRKFEKLAQCRYCYQTEHWEHSCIQKANCNSVASPRAYYKTNCTVSSDVICLGKRTFPKRIQCNWTGGARWSTALVLSLTLGGFGADRFYLGHWQEGVGKLFSFGGLGVWTLLDVVLISVHHLGPADGSLYI